MSKRIRIGDFGLALSKASREHRSVYWLKHQLDVLYTKLREQNKKRNKRKFNDSKKQDSRRTVSKDV